MRRNFTHDDRLWLNAHTYINIPDDPYGSIRPSAEPNCYLERYIINRDGRGEIRVRIFTLKSIRAGDELTFGNFGLLPFRCAECSGVSKSTRYEMEEHYNVAHGIRFYTCPDCGEGVSHGLELVAHRKKHKQTRPSSRLKRDIHHCVICTSSGWKSVFSSRGNLKRHVQSHYPELHYMCAIRGCGYQDTRSDKVLCHHREDHRQFKVTPRPIRISASYFPRYCSFCASHRCYGTWLEWWLHIEKHCRLWATPSI